MTKTRPSGEPARSESKPSLAEGRERLAGALEGVGRRARGSLRGLGRSMADVGDRLRATPAGERLQATVGMRRVLRKAADAQRRQNPAMAFRLLEPLALEHPEDPHVVVPFWEAARACGRSGEVAPAVVGLVRGLSRDGRQKRAAELWKELHEVEPEMLVDPGTLARIAPVLAEGEDAEATVAALRDAVDDRNTGLTPGMAVRIAEMALELDPPTAVRAARFALAAPDLHASRREYVEGIIAGSMAAAGGAGRPAEVEAEAAVVARTLEHAHPAARFQSVKATEAMPIGFHEDGIALLTEGGRKARVVYTKIDAVAVASVADVVVIDLALNWGCEGDEVLRLVRLRGDGFDPRMVFDAAGALADPLAAFVAELIARSHAAALPDPDSVLGGVPRAFDDLARYEREVLLVERAAS